MIREGMFNFCASKIKYKFLSVHYLIINISRKYQIYIIYSSHVTTNRYLCAVQLVNIINIIIRVVSLAHFLVVQCGKITLK